MSRVKNVEGGRLKFHCPGCEHAHVVPVSQPGGWTFTGDMKLPTLHPSLLNSHPAYPEEGIPAYCCHLWVKNGTLEFLPDCTHKLAGKTVEMAEEE